MNSPAATDTPPDGLGQLLSIGEAAERAGVSPRALRYYQQIGLITPSACTPGGLRRYSEDNLARVVRIRELQDLLGLNLDEIAAVLHNEDRLAELRIAYHDVRTDEKERQSILDACLSLQLDLRATVELKRIAISEFLADLDARIRRIELLKLERAGQET
jgi:MerR family transcriptional regulator, repressor of the yfmOP operon